LPAPVLHLQLESGLPDALVGGAPTALFLCGWCFCPDDDLEALELLVGEDPQPVTAHRMPRLEPFQALHPALDAFATAELTRDDASPDDPSLRSYRSGFWGIARVPALAPGTELALGLRGRLRGGGQARAPLAQLPVSAPPAPLSVTWPDPGAGAPVAICMATYNPPRELLTRQLDSIRAQAHNNWVCVISDDQSDPPGVEILRDAIGDDPRFMISTAPARLGFYRNFERALALTPSDAAYVALADQDDAWYPDKLPTLLHAIGDATLAFSDARVVARDGTVISDTWWSTRRPGYTDLLSLLVANSVTGAASLMPRWLLDDVLPFPPAQFAHFHDHWIALVALALGRIEYVPRPLYDYVQHGSASLGHAGANQMTSLRQRLRRRRHLHERVRMWRLHYFVDVSRLTQFATVLTLRCGPRMSRAKRRQLARFTRADTALAPLLVLALRGARELMAATPETLGAEWMLAHAFAWRRLLALSARSRPTRSLRLDAQPPPSLVMEPGRAGVHEAARVMHEKVAPLRFAAHAGAPPRVNLLIPTIDLKHFFGGYITKLALAKRLAQAGARVRIVTADPVGPLPSAWRSTLESYSGLDGVFDAVEVVFGREAATIPCSPQDTFIATTWWTAHVANAALATVAAQRFLYLIQEFEPFTFAMGTWAALAAESYTFEHTALFSSELLRGYFQAHRLGVYAGGREAGERLSRSFQNAITPVRAPSVQELAGRSVRKLLFYARPEAHAARNMFELGVLALARALRNGAFADGWELHGIGTVEQGGQIPLGGSNSLRLLPRAAQSAYGSMLREHDVGLALMYTPHPSLVPIEMASAGLVTVTTAFENKTPEAMTAISPNIIAAPPTLAGVAAALAQAERRALDLHARVQGSAVHWATDWKTAFDAALLDWVLEALR
jgi:glycosyltransferase involved in cell wall biosynthesis